MAAAVLLKSRYKDMCRLKQRLVCYCMLDMHRRGLEKILAKIIVIFTLKGQHKLGSVFKSTLGVTNRNIDPLNTFELIVKAAVR